MYKKYIISILIRLPAPFILGMSIYLSALPSIPPLEGIKFSDKLIHFVCFAGLAGAWSWWWPYAKLKTRRRGLLRAALLTVCAVSAYGILDEYHQSFTPGRECSFFDWLADTGGAALGSAAGFLSLYAADKWMRPRRPNQSVQSPKK